MRRVARRISIFLWPVKDHGFFEHLTYLDLSHCLD